MSILNRLIQQETRASVSSTNPKDPVLADWFGGRTNTAAGISVTADSAMRIATVFGCVRILSSAIASLPLDIFQRLDNGGREKARNHSLYSVLHDQPNKWQTSFEFREMQAMHLLLRGNGYSYIVPGTNKPVGELIPLHPDRVRPFKAPDGTVAYAYTDESGVEHIYLQEEIFHLRGMGFDGIKGLSPIEYQRESMGLTMAAEQFGASYFGNGTVIGGVLEHPQKLSPEAYDRLKESWADRHSGGVNAHKPAILEEGMKWQALGVPPNQAQFLETRKFQRSEIAMIFGVPPHMLGDVEKATSWGSGIESQGIGFVIYSLRPWLVRWEQCIKRDLFTTQDKLKFFPEFNVDGLLRGDSKARAEYFNKGIQDGWLTRNEARLKENLNPLDGLDEPLVPLNMTEAGNEPAPEDEDVQTDEGDETLERMHHDQFSKAIDRIVTCEVKALRRALNASGNDAEEFERRAALFYGGHDPFVARQLEGLVGNGLNGFIRSHMIDSIASVKHALESGVQNVRDLIDLWDMTRADELVEKHAAQALEGVKNGY